MVSWSRGGARRYSLANKAGPLFAAAWHYSGRDNNSKGRPGYHGFWPAASRALPGPGPGQERTDYFDLASHAGTTRSTRLYPAAFRQNVRGLCGADIYAAAQTDWISAKAATPEGSGKDQ